MTGGEFTPVSESGVSVIWAMRDRLVFKPCGPVAFSMQGYGHYHEVWQRHEGVWRLKRLELHRTLIELSPFARMLDGAAKLLRL